MRVSVVGADTMLGLGVTMRLRSLGHTVVGVGRRLPPSWPGAAVFVETDTPDAAVLGDALNGADAVVHCERATAGSATALIDAMATAAVPRGVHVSTLDGHDPVADMFSASTADWVVLRCGLILGEHSEDDVVARFAAPVLRGRDESFAVVHPYDVQRMVVRAVLDPGTLSGPVDLVAGSVTFGEIAAALGRPVLGLRKGVRAKESDAQPGADFSPVWSAAECVDDFALTVRARVAVGGRLVALPWRLARVRQVPAADAPAGDGVPVSYAARDAPDGEFDTPIDPRFPSFVATNLSEALPGPFSPSSASVSVRGVRAAGSVIASRLRPGGVVQHEMAARTTGVFGHRLYGGLSSSYFMACTVPVIDPQRILRGFFGPTAADLPVLGTDPDVGGERGVGKQLRGLLIFAGNLVGLSAGANRDSTDYVDDIEGLKLAAKHADSLDDERLRALIVSARDHVVHGWVLASASLLVCTAYQVLLRLLTGFDAMPVVGRDAVSARPLAAVRELAALARESPILSGLLRETRVGLDDFADVVPDYHDAVERALDRIGHRGPAEVEMRSESLADDPRLLLQMIGHALDHPVEAGAPPPGLPIWARPVAAAAATQLRDREVRRDRMVVAIAILRGLLREYGRRLVARGEIADVDDVFFLLVDELDAPPPDVAEVVARRRREQQELSTLVPPEAFSGVWSAHEPSVAALRAGESLAGLGVCGGRVRGTVRVVSADTVDQVLPGEVLVAAVTDVGYTPVFAYAAAVVTELGGPLSHAAVVAREYGVPCVVGAREATSRLTTGMTVEVDGGSGLVTVVKSPPLMPPA